MLLTNSEMAGPILIRLSAKHQINVVRDFVKFGSKIII